jgi:ABC-2 type transport system permease protein
MSSKTIPEKQDDRVVERPLPGAALPPPRESAPSFISEDTPALPRTVGMIGAAFVIFGGMALGFNLYGQAVRVSTGWSLFFVTLGLCGLLFHAAFDRDLQIRRMYMVFGLGTLALAVILGAIGQFRWGVPCAGIALLFLLAFLRNEQDPFLRNLAQLLLGGVGLAMALIGLVGGNVRGDFFLPHGLVLSVLGLVYVAAYVGSRGISDDRAYYTAVAIALAGLAVMLVALVRSVFPLGGIRYFTSYGAILLTVGLGYALTGAGLFSDRPLAVLTRRELGAFFYSPLAYLTLFGFVIFSFIAYWLFIDQLILADPRQPLTEPIVSSYFFALFPVFTAVIVVPVMTMRLFSEEHRSGTLEVLLTAPVEEVTVVLSKFLAALLTYLLMWAPFFLFLVAIPLAGGNPFDYRPLLSFFIALAFTGAAFVAGGVFFSSLTKSQIASGVLTGAFMMLLTFVYFLAHDQRLAGSNWDLVFKHVSYLDLWLQSLQGLIVIKFLLFFLSLTVLFLFLTVKVLESRKWR